MEMLLRQKLFMTTLPDIEAAIKQLPEQDVRQPNHYPVTSDLQKNFSYPPSLVGKG